MHHKTGLHLISQGYYISTLWLAVVWKPLPCFYSGIQFLLFAALTIGLSNLLADYEKSSLHISSKYMQIKYSDLFSSVVALQAELSVS